MTQFKNRVFSASLLLNAALTWTLLCPLTGWSQDNRNFTAEEHTRFIDAPDKFVRNSLPSFWTNGAHNNVYWLDTERLILTARKLPSGWQATDEEVSKIVILNTKTGEIESTPYRGDLECYSPERIVIRSYQEGTGGQHYLGAPYHGEVILAGKLGERLEPIQWKRGDRLVDVGCQIISHDGIAGYRIYHLPAWDAVLRVSVPYEKPWKDGITIRTDYAEKVLLEDSKGHLVAQMGGSFNTAPPAMGFYFLPFRNQYFVQSAFGVGQPGRLYNSDGSHLNLEEPLMLSRIGGGYPWVMQSGILWELRPFGSRWPKQGLYWQAGDRPMIHDGDIIYRVDNARPTNMAVSPDGCKNFYRRFSGEPFPVSPRTKTISETVVMNVCQRKEE
jgi:hypothetical protein